MDKIFTTAVKASIVVIVITHDNESTDNNIYKIMIVKITFFSIKLCTHQANTHLNLYKLKKENIQIDKNQDYTKSNS